VFLDKFFAPFVPNETALNTVHNNCKMYSFPTATGRHLPRGITQYYLPPYTSEHTPP